MMGNLKYIFAGLLIIALSVFVFLLPKSEPSDDTPNNMATTTEPVATSTPIVPVANELFRKLAKSEECKVPQELTFFDSVSASQYVPYFKASFSTYAPEEILPKAIGGG